MALSVRMGAFLVDPLMGLPTCARRCFKVFFGHAVLPRKFLRKQTCRPPSKAKPLGIGTRQPHDDGFRSPCGGFADSFGTRRPQVYCRRMGRGGYARAHFVL